MARSVEPWQRSYLADTMFEHGEGGDPCPAMVGVYDGGLGWASPCLFAQDIRKIPDYARGVHRRCPVHGAASSAF